MGGYTLPTPSTPGYTSFRGFTSCDCLAKWLPVFERLLVLEGYIKQSIDILQLTGDYAMSGGNHRAGGVFDIKQYDTRIVAIAREMGAPATWLRNMNYANGSPGNTHTHGVLTGCDHNWPAAYQIPAQRRGYNGMGQGWYGGQYLWGYGGKDPHPDPKTYRTWTQGIAWAEARIAYLEDEMSFTDTDRAELNSKLDKADGATLRNDLGWQNKTNAAAFAALTDLITKLTAKVDGVATGLSDLKTEVDAVKGEVEALPKA